MSETTNLKLFKHNEPLAENESEFDIDKALHQNWDKIDEFAGKVNEKNKEQDDRIETNENNIQTNTTNIETLQQENASKTEQIEQLQKENTELKQANKELKNNLDNVLIPGYTEEGEYLSIKDSTRYPFKKLEISGNSWQEKREGYNIFNINNNYLAGQTVNLAGVDITFNTDGSITLNGTAKENDLYIVNQDYQIKPTKDFYLVFEHLGGTISITKSTTFTCREVKGSEVIYTNLVPLATSGTNISKITYNNADHYDRWRLYVQKNCVFTNYKIRVWVSCKDTTEFEQYGAMPSIDYPSQIRNCGDNVNIFDGELELGSINDSDGQNTSSTNTIRSKNFNEIKAEKEIVLSGLNNANIYFYDKDKKFISRTTTKNAEVPNLAKYFKLRSWASDNVIDLNAKIKVEKGSVATPYSPFGRGNVNFKVCNENFLEIDKGKEKTFNGLTVSFLENGNIKINGIAEWTSYVNLLNMSDGNTNNFAKRFFPLGDYYIYFNYISGKILNSNFSVNLRTGALDDNSSTTVANGRNSSNYTLSDLKKGTIKDNLLVSYIWINKGASFENYEFNVQLKKEDLKPDFIPHESQSFTFPMKEGQVLHEGDFLANDGVHHVGEKINFSNITNNIDTSKAKTVTVSIKLSKKIAENGYIYSNILKCENNWNDTEHINIGGDRSTLYLMLNKDRFETLDYATIKQVLTEIEGYAIYQTETESIEPYSKDQQLVWAEIKKAISYKGGTNVFSQDEISPKFKAIYFKDLETLLAGGGN